MLPQKPVSRNLQQYLNTDFTNSLQQLILFVCECLKTKSTEYDAEAGSSKQRQPKRKRGSVTVEEALMLVVSHPHLLWRTCNIEARRDYNKVLSTMFQKIPMPHICLNGRF